MSKRKLFLTVFLTLMAIGLPKGFVLAAVTFDTFTDGSFANTNLSWSHNNSGNALVVNLTNESATPASCTYDGQAMTLATNPVQANGSTAYINMFYFLSAPTGNKTVACTGSASGMQAVSASYAGVNSIGANATSTGGGTSYSITTNTTVADTWTVWALSKTSGGAYTAGANTTLRGQSASANVDSAAVLDSNGTTHSTGNFTMNATDGNLNWGGAAIELLETGGSGTSTSATGTPLTTDGASMTYFFGIVTFFIGFVIMRNI